MERKKGGGYGKLQKTELQNTKSFGINFQTLLCEEKY